MKLLAPTLVLALASFAWLAPSTVGAPTRQEGGQGRPEGKEEHSPLEERMHSMEDALKALRRSLRDPAKQSDSLASLAKLQADIVVAKAESPRMLPRVPEAERAKFVADYRREMLHMLELSITVERALLDGKQEAALAAFEELRGLEDPAHARFTEEER